MIFGTPTNDMVSIGGKRYFNNPQNLVLLGALITGGKYSVLRDLNSVVAAGYVVPAAKTLRIIGISSLCVAFTSQTLIYMQYGDNDVGLNSAANQTTPKYPGGATDWQIILSNIAVTGQYTIAEDIIFDVPTGKYPAINTAGGGTATACLKVYGYLY